MKVLSRRSALAAGLASFAALGLSNAQAAPASVPVIWDGKKMFESFEKEATGISSQGPAGGPKAYLAFDTQCRDCWQLHRKLEPFMDKIEFVFRHFDSPFNIRSVSRVILFHSERKDS